MKGDEALVMTSRVIIFAVFFSKEKKFYSANEAYVLTNEEDATKSFNSVNATTKQYSVP